ncbi:MAG: hypothetical protein QME60_04540 [Verrucomicrobiota bacterium]|nr:hypothetical protein [Verrucomicrobiota bacterium]
MAITVKKKLTVRTVKVMATDEPGVEPAAEGAAPGTDEIAPASEEAAQAVEAALSAVAAPVAVAGPVGKPASYLVAGIFGIVAVLCFIALLIIQWLEWDFYQGAFPVGAPAAGSGFAPPPPVVAPSATPVAEDKAPPANP